ncbi:hypothetical protein NL676_016178 [Syzygium grande]|nr:hypothetical protein NL676_016178 [Syzygium grande]
MNSGGEDPRPPLCVPAHPSRGPDQEEAASASCRHPSAPPSSSKTDINSSKARCGPSSVCSFILTYVLKE